MFDRVRWRVSCCLNINPNERGLTVLLYASFDYRSGWPQASSNIKRCGWHSLVDFFVRISSMDQRVRSPSPDVASEDSD